jgi:hypothetical protein
MEPNAYAHLGEIGVGDSMLEHPCQHAYDACCVAVIVQRELRTCGGETTTAAVRDRAGRSVARSGWLPLGCWSTSRRSSFGRWLGLGAECSS